MASNLKTITDAMTGQIDSEGAGKKERAFEEQKRHDELVRAQSEGDSIGDSPEVKIKGGGFLEKLGTNVGTGLKSIIDGIFGAIKAFIDGIGSLLNAALKIVQNFVNKVGNIIQSIAKTISKTFVTLMKGLGQGIAFFFRAIGSVPISAILKGALVDIAADGIVRIDGIGIQLNGTSEPALKGKAFLEVFKDHQHTSSVGPTGPIMPQYAMNALKTMSKKVFLG